MRDRSIAGWKAKSKFSSVWPVGIFELFSIVRMRRSSRPARSARPRHHNRRPLQAGGGWLRLLEIGAQIIRSVRRIKIAMAFACPAATAFRLAHARLCT
jgi:hypothetical protein